MTQLWLIRHGQTDWNIEGRWQGQAQAAPALNRAGRAQAQAVAELLNGQVFAALYSSDLRRAHETAEIIAARLGLPVTLEPRLREINQGIWEGVLGSDVARQYPVEHAARQHDPLHSRAPGGESVAEVAERLRAAADDIAAAQPAGQVLIVSHGLALATLICRARGAPLSQAFQMIPDNARPEIIDWTAAGA